MTAQVWLNPLASLSHGEVMIDYVINDCCPTVISLEHLTRMPRPLTGAPLPLPRPLPCPRPCPCLGCWWWPPRSMLGINIFLPLLEVENYLISCAQRVHTGADDI